MVARGNSLSPDRGDVEYAVKELSRYMAKPRITDASALKRLARYLVTHPRMVSKLHKQKRPTFIEGWSDSDWAGCLETRKTTSGGGHQMGITHIENMEFCPKCDIPLFWRGGIPRPREGSVAGTWDESHV